MEMGQVQDAGHGIDDTKVRKELNRGGGVFWGGLKNGIRSGGIHLASERKMSHDEGCITYLYSSVNNLMAKKRNELNFCKVTKRPI